MQVEGGATQREISIGQAYIFNSSTQGKTSC